ncbi:hypothetical protein [Yoonia sp.]|uniref:hypothetical protein n=1 Tax=Yoonia sp. TaxID=2212373 RepID=UPI00358F78D8
MPDLSFIHARVAVYFFNCYFAEQPQMVQLQADGLALVGCIPRTKRQSVWMT